MSPPDSFPFPHTQPLPEDVAGPLATAADRLGPFGRQILWYAELSSTNDLAGGFAERGAREGCVVVAEAQRAGRGRQGRAWSSPPGSGLYMSIVLRPDARATPLLTLTAGVAMVEGIRAATGMTMTLKWPNDVYAPGPSGRKVSGILAEAAGIALPDRGSRIADRGSYVVLGIGINIHAGALPPDVAARATSLDAETGREVSRGVVLAECLAALASRYDDLRHGRSSAVMAAWREYARPMLGRVVEWDSAEWDGVARVERGIAEDVDDSGALVVRTGDRITRLVSGDVRWV